MKRMTITFDDDVYEKIRSHRIDELKASRECSVTKAVNDLIRKANLEESK